MAVGFGTSISPWIVTMEALQPFRCSPKTKQDPLPFDHLRWPTENDGAIDIKLRVLLRRRWPDTKYTQKVSSSCISRCRQNASAGE